MHKPPSRAHTLLLSSALAVLGACTSSAEAEQERRAPVTAAPPREVAAGLADANRLGEAFAAIAERVSPSVVSIRVEQRAQKQTGLTGPMPFPFFGPGPGAAPFAQSPIRRGEGSGVILSSDGAILTNHHVVENATRIEVHLKDGRRFRGTVAGSDPATDLAVVKIPAHGLAAASFGRSGDMHVGQWVLAIGSPFGLDYTVTAGVLSATGRAGIGASEIEDYLQTDASINPGNSGGPLVNLAGEVVGINTMIIGHGTGIGFAVPSDIAKDVSDQLLEKGRVARAWIGVGFQELTPELAAQFGTNAEAGALVSSVDPDGPAARAGVQPGDIVRSVDGHAIREGRDLLRAVLRSRVGNAVRLDVIRQGRSRSLSVTTAERPAQVAQGGTTAPTPAPPATGRMGLALQPHAEGALVAAVTPGSPADRAGLRPGDVLTEADRRPIREPADVSTAFQDGTTLLRVAREGHAIYVVVERDES